MKYWRHFMEDIAIDNSIKGSVAVLIPTLCRYESLIRCIDSLKKNTKANIADIYIGLDYPIKEAHWEGYHKIKSMLSEPISGFANVYIFKHDKNLGGTDNLEFLRKEACKTHSKFIYSEDDNEFSPNYLDYMNQLLDQYEDDPSVFAIGGFAYPVGCEVKSGDTYSNNIYLSAFGLGLWKHKYEVMKKALSIEGIDAMYKNRAKMKQLAKEAPNQFCNFVRGRLGYKSTIYHKEQVWLIDLTMGVYMYMNDMKAIYPVTSKVRNWGFDGQGENCNIIEFKKEKNISHRNLDINCQKLDTNIDMRNTQLVEDSENQYINTLIGKYFKVPKIEVLRARAAYRLSLLVGIENVEKLLRRY